VLVSMSDRIVARVGRLGVVVLLSVLGVGNGVVRRLGRVGLGVLGLGICVRVRIVSRLLGTRFGLLPGLLGVLVCIGIRYRRSRLVSVTVGQILHSLMLVRLPGGVDGVALRLIGLSFVFRIGDHRLSFRADHPWHFVRLGLVELVLGVPVGYLLNDLVLEVG